MRQAYTGIGTSTGSYSLRDLVASWVGVPIVTLAITGGIMLGFQLIYSLVQ